MHHHFMTSGSLEKPGESARVQVTQRPGKTDMQNIHVRLKCLRISIFADSFFYFFQRTRGVAASFFPLSLLEKLENVLPKMLDKTFAHNYKEGYNWKDLNWVMQLKRLHHCVCKTCSQSLKFSSAQSQNATVVNTICMFTALRLSLLWSPMCDR